MNNINKIINDIKSLKVQGATNVAKVTLQFLGQWSKDTDWTKAQLSTVTNNILSARPTEPLAQNCVKWLLDYAKTREGKSLEDKTQEIINNITASKQKIITRGVSLVKDNMTLLTHCHSKTVSGILIEAKKHGINFKVYLTETRPRYQGHITAQELTNENIDATLITDSEASYVISREDNIKIDLILVGADAMDKTGSAYNKVGSYGISLSAKNANLPFYVAASLLKFSPTPVIIPERDFKEVWDQAPSNLKILNLAFDKIPGKNIDSFITEIGLVKPNDLVDTVKIHYPWIFSKL